MVSSVGTCSEAGRPFSGDSEPRTAFLRRFRAPDGLSPVIPSAFLHRTPKHSAAFQNCSPEIYFKTAISEQQLFNPPELSQTKAKWTSRSNLAAPLYRKTDEIETRSCRKARVFVECTSRSQAEQSTRRQPCS
ncbi:hypothetical protein KSP39_PZI020536 [Platanthera zijinensis]|uniref:Uncharacterized protein n=1 Tax=Platanthera zijinensis TaxID=2320716 RepID=A0AAP0AZL3_9ASPA